MSALFAAPAIVILTLLGDGALQQSAAAALEAAAAALRQGDYQKALPLAETAVAVSEREGNQLTLARSLGELGRAQWGRAQYAAAQATLTRGLALAARLEHFELQSEMTMRLGETAFSLGQYEEALAHYDRALAFNRRAPVRVREALINTNIGVALRFLGRYEDAAATTESALGMFRELGNEAGAGQALTFLGIIHRARANYQQAIDAYTAAIAIRERLGDRRGQAQVLGNLGNVYLDLGDHLRAVDAYTRSLTIAEAVAYTAQAAFARANLAAALGELGRTAEALTRSQEALAAWRELKRVPEIGRTLRVIALQHLHGTRDLAAARSALDEALSIARTLKDAELEASASIDLAALEHAAGDAGASSTHYTAAQRLIDTLDSADLRYRLLGQRGRTRLMAGDVDRAIEDLHASTAIINDLRAAVSSDDGKIAFVDTRQSAFQDLAIALLKKGRTADALEAAEAARARAFADALASRQSPDRGAASPSAAEIRGVARTTASAIVEYLITPEALLAWVVTPGGEIHVAQTAIPAAQVDALVRQVLDAMDAWSPAADDVRVRRLLRQLHHVTIAPIVKWLPPTPAPIIIVPYGSLSQVPFAALEDTTAVPLIARHRLSVVPSVSAFRYTAAARKKSRTAVIYAAPTPPKDSGLQPLPGSLDEAGRVSRRLAEWKPAVLTGARASEQSAKAGIGAATYVHFATHGLVSETRAMNSSLVLTASGGDDGYLRAREVYGLKLSADLVVLSGCSTARGRFTGDGVFGLPRAFLYAGARSVVASLWEISDRATVFLMDRFYAALLTTPDKAAALRTAQLETRKQYPHPALWAPFILIGETR